VIGGSADTFLVLAYLIADDPSQVSIKTPNLTSRQREEKSGKRSTQDSRLLLLNLALFPNRGANSNGISRGGEISLCLG
jgi:hypothetical protein